MQKQLYIWICLLVLLCSMGYAQPPVTTVFSGDQGFDIKVPIILDVKKGHGLTLHFHLFNASNGVPMLYSNQACYFHLYNTTGNHIYKLNNINTIVDDFDYEVSLSGNNFSKSGEYSYIFQCNSTDLQGGFVNAELIVTESGMYQNLDAEYWVLGIIVGVVLIAFLIVAIVVPYLPARAGAGLLAGFMVVTSFRLGAEIVEQINSNATSLIGIMDTAYAWSLNIWVFSLSLTVILLAIYGIMYLTTWKERKRNEKEESMNGFQ